MERHAIYRQVLLARVADLATDAGEPEQMALDVLEHVRAVAPLHPPEVIDDTPADTLVRGWGYCDALAMAYVQLLERIGMRGRMLFLWNDEGISPHTVAAVHLDGDWRVIDPQTGVVPRTANGAIATVDDIASGAAPITGDWVEPPDYERATVFYETATGRLRRAARAVAEVAASAAPHLVQDLYLATPPITYVTIDGVVWEDWTDPDDRFYWRARHYDLFDRHAKARAAYNAVGHDANRYAEATYFSDRSPAADR